MAIRADLSVPMLQEGALLSPWVLAIIAVILIALFIWLLLRWQWKKAAPPAQAAQPAAPVHQQAAPEPPAPVMAAAPIAPDDLEIIEGIGPKICAVLNQAGVTTFAQLAGMDPAKISEIMQAAGIRLGDPRSWPEQARLAAAGDMEGLKTLQDNLKGGRAV